MERKVAALKDAEERSEMALNEPLEFFAAKDYKARIPPKQTRTPRKQAKPRKSKAELQEQNVEILNSSYNENNENIQQEAAKEESKETKGKKTSGTGHMQQHFATKPTTKIGMDRTFWSQISRSQREPERKRESQKLENKSDRS